MNKVIPSWMVVITLFLTISSCTDDYFEFDKFKVDPLKPEIAIPLINSSLTPQDLLLNDETPDIITTNSDGLITIIYEKGGFEIKTDDLFTIENQSFNESIGFTTTEISAFPVQGTISKSFTENYNFSNPNGVRLDSMLARSGLLTVSLNSDLAHGGNVTVTFPSFTAKGNQLSFNLPLDYTGTTPVTSSNTTNLDEYTLTVDNSSGSTIPVRYDITVNYTGNAISPQDSLRLSIGTQNIQFKSFFGFAGQQTFTFPEDTLALALFGGAISGNFYAAEPKMSIITTNGFGIPISVQFNRFDANTVNSGIIPLQLPQNPTNINAPTSAGDSAITSIVLDANNSNIDNIVSSLPRDFIFDFTASTNPNNTTSQNFVIDQNRASVAIRFELPLIGTVSDYVLLDTFDFDFDDTQLLDAATFRTNITNGFPIDADLQLYFADADSKILDSLFTGQKKIIISGTIDSDGKVIQPSNATEDTDIDKIGLTNLFRSSKIIIKANLSSTNNGGNIVQFYDNYRMDVKLGMKAKFNLDFE